MARAMFVGGGVKAKTGIIAGKKYAIIVQPSGATVTTVESASDSVYKKRTVGGGRLSRAVKFSLNQKFEAQFGRDADGKPRNWKGGGK